MLHDDLEKEYYSLQGQIGQFDDKALSVKEWSVTLSLVALGLGFQTGHYSLFILAALTAAGFWFLNGLLKGFQVRHYSRAREIEVIAHALNRVEIEGIGVVSSPQINWSWTYAGMTPGAPQRRTEMQERLSLKRRFFYGNVMLPHAVAVGLGLGLFAAAALDVPGLAHLAL